MMDIVDVLRTCIAEGEHGSDFDVLPGGAAKIAADEIERLRASTRAGISTQKRTKRDLATAIGAIESAGYAVAKLEWKGGDLYCLDFRFGCIYPSPLGEWHWTERKAVSSKGFKTKHEAQVACEAAVRKAMRGE